jgi:hypothetical protein
LIFSSPQILFSQSVFKPRGDTASRAQLKIQLDELKQVVAEKINYDVQTTARAFTDSENIFRSLKIAYPFKALLDSIADGFAIVGSLTDFSNVDSVLKGSVKAPIFIATFGVAYENVQENAGKLALVFNGNKYVGSVNQMVGEAKAGQPALGFGFDSTRYLNSITLWMNGNQGRDLIFVKRGKKKGYCEPFTPRGDPSPNRPTLFGMGEFRKNVAQQLREIEMKIENPKVSEAEIGILTTVVKQAKTALLASKNGERTHTLVLSPDIILPNCRASEAKIQLGKITALQNDFAESLTAFDQRAFFKQVITVKTGVDIITSYVETRVSKGKSNQRTDKILKRYSHFSLGFDLGAIATEKVFKFNLKPEEQIADLPQQMLLNLSSEFSNVALLLDSLDSIVQQAVISEFQVKEMPPISISPIPTLFLLDTSGSMSENGKIEQARAAGLDALQAIRRSAANTPTAVRIFAGDCNPRGTRSLSGFSPNLNQAETIFRAGIPRPDGGTPLPQGKDAAIAEMIAYLNTHPEIKAGRIILLSDGQSTCGEIRPAGVFSRRDFSFHQSSIRFLTVGFDVPVGSGAERDLQFLASETGGKYYPAADHSQLIRAFQKHLRFYQPRPCRMSDAGFAAGINAFGDHNYPAALQFFRAFVAANPTDSCAIYNLALAFEANDRYKSAAETYRKYLEALPSAADRAETERRIAELQRDYAEQFRYFIAVANSDLDYLKRYYQSVFNRSNSELAIEFTGFVREKREFYANLPEILETDIKWLRNDSRDLADSIDSLAERTKMESFDRDAVSLLTIPIAQLEDLIGRLNNYAANGLR